jgi:excisionase family DNA binding protein
MENPNISRENFDRHEAARRLGVSTVTIDRLTAAGRLRHFRIGRRTLFCQSHLDEFLAKQEIPPQERPAQKSRKY